MHHIKLQESPRTRVRVHEIAKKVGAPTKQVLQVLRDMGEYVNSAANYVETPIAREVYKHFDVAYPEDGPSPSVPDSVTNQ